MLLDARIREDEDELVEKQQKSNKELQFWKLDGLELKNKAKLWMSNDEWNLKTKERDVATVPHFTLFQPTWDNLIYLENISRKKVLGITRAGEVIEEDFVEDKPGQLWKRGVPDAEGFFVLENSEFLRSDSDKLGQGLKWGQSESGDDLMFHPEKVMTAISSSSLKIKGT